MPDLIGSSYSTGSCCWECRACGRRHWEPGWCPQSVWGGGRYWKQSGLEHAEQLCLGCRAWLILDIEDTAFKKKKPSAVWNCRVDAWNCCRSCCGVQTKWHSSRNCLVWGRTPGQCNIQCHNPTMLQVEEDIKISINPLKYENIRRLDCNEDHKNMLSSSMKYQSVHTLSFPRALISRCVKRPLRSPVRVPYLQAQPGWVLFHTAPLTLLTSTQRVSLQLYMILTPAPPVITTT